MLACILILSVLLPQDEATKALERLRSSIASEREEGERLLRELGVAAKPELLRAVGDKDPEVAARSRRLLRILEIEETLPSALRAAIPGVADRLAGEDFAWTELFLNLAERVRPDDQDLRPEDLEPLLDRAIRGARTPEDREHLAAGAGNLGLRRAVPFLLAELKSGTPQEKSAAALALSSLRVRESIPMMKALLTELPPDQRWAAFAALGRIGALSEAPHIAGFLKDPDLRDSALETLRDLYAWRQTSEILPLLDPSSPLCENAGRALGRLGAREVAPRIAALLGHKEPRIRRMSVEVLAQLDAQPSAAAIAGLLEDPDPEISEAAALALYELGDPATGPALAAHFRKLPSKLRTFTLSALVRVDGSLAAQELSSILLGKSSIEDQAAAVSHLRTLRPRDAAPVVLQLLRQESDSLVSQGIELAQHLAIPETGSLLLGIFQGPQTKLHGQALYALQEIAPPEKALELGKLLEAQVPMERGTLVTAMVRIGGRTAAPTLLAEYGGLLRDCRWTVLEELADLKIPEVVPLVLKAVEESDPTVREAALWSAGLLKLREAGPRAVELLADVDPRIRAAAAFVCLRLGMRHGGPKLKPRLQSSDAGEVESTLALLSLVGGPEVVADILPLLGRKEDSVVAVAADTLSDLGATEALPALAPLLGRRDSTVRREAALAIARLGKEKAVPILRPLLSRSDEGARLAAIEALGWTSSPLAAAELTPLTTSGTDRERAAALDALLRLGAKEATGETLRLLEDSEESVRRVAVLAAETLELREAVPALVRLQFGIDVELRDAASRALVCLGSKEGVPRILRNRNDLWFLNALRSPGSWKRLKSTFASPTIEGPPAAVLEAIARQGGLSIDQKRASLRQGGEGWTNPGGGLRYGQHIMCGVGVPRDPWRMSGLEAKTLLECLEELTWERNLVIVLDEATLRLLPRDEGLDFWNEWWRTQAPR